MVNFSEIAKVLEVRASRLLRKKNIPDIIANLTGLYGDDEENVVRKKGKEFLTLPGLAVAAIKTRARISPEKIQQWEEKYGRADIPQQIGTSTPALLRHILSTLGDGKFRCVLKSGKWFFSLNDLVKLATRDRNTGRTIDKVVSSYPELKELLSQEHAFR